MPQPIPYPQSASGLARLAPGHLLRPRLSEALLKGDCRLRLLCAPVGSGKSAILSECIQHLPAGIRLVHLNLRGKPLTGDAFAQRLSGALGLNDTDIAGLQRYLDNVSSGLWLVMDDYPRIPDQAFDDVLNDLIQTSSSHVQWWLAGRRRPGLQLTRLLLDGDLFELGSAELSFNEQELAELLRQKELHWPWPVIGKLHSDSQGWCAGVRLYLLAQKDDGEAQSYDSSAARVFEYLRHEALDELPHEWRQALYTLAQLSYFDAGLCEQLLGVGEGEQLLKQLVVCGLFIETVGVDEQAYRVQPAMLAALAGQLPANLTKAVFRKACQWYVSQDDVRLALEYAVRAEQTEVAATLMQRFTGDVMLQGRRLGQLMQWRREVPIDLLTGTPRLLLLNAWALLLSGRLVEAQAYTDQVARFMPQPTAERQFELIAQWKALTGNLAFHYGQSEAAHQWLAEAIAELPERAWGQRMFCLALQIEQALIDGQLEQAQELNRVATKLARQHASLAMESVMVLGHVKLLEIRGELLRAETLLKRLYTELTNAWGAELSPMRGRVQLRRATLLVQQGRFEEAVAIYQSGIKEAEACGDPAAFWGYVGLAEIDAQEGELDSAFLRIADAERAMQYNHVSEHLYQGVVLRARARLWLGQGRSAQAEKALRNLPGHWLSASPYGLPDLNLRLYLLQLQASLATGEVDTSLAKLVELHAKTVAEGRRALACEVGFSLAEALYASNKPAQAKQALLDAIAEARQMGMVSVERAFARRNRALSRWVGESNQNDEVPASLLSRRELDVLKLIAQGFSNQQIAESLYISLHTVKTHAQRINFKLGVERRTQAVARAKELGLS
ncbi:TPA: helix-turn-helix transcriptional regulator [Pseudomonas putida]|nr:helix-turn-helix transcriptional regulator [Pseudomonas putida]